MSVPSEWSSGTQDNEDGYVQVSRQRRTRRAGVSQACCAPIYAEFVALRGESLPIATARAL